jgi:hypothetical protein
VLAESHSDLYSMNASGWSLDVDSSTHDNMDYRLLVRYDCSDEHELDEGNQLNESST